MASLSTPGQCPSPFVSSYNSDDLSPRGFQFREASFCPRLKAASDGGPLGLQVRGVVGETGPGGPTVLRKGWRAGGLQRSGLGRGAGTQPGSDPTRSSARGRLAPPGPWAPDRTAPSWSFLQWDPRANNSGSGHT